MAGPKDTASDSARVDAPLREVEYLLFDEVVVLCDAIDERREQIERAFRV